MDFQYVAWGNARMNGTKVECQHGAKECFGNMAENCVANVTGYDPVKYMPFMLCLEGMYTPMSQAQVNTCCTQSGIDEAKVNACMQGPLGKVLVQQAYKETPAAHKYVPWVVGPDGKTFNPETKEVIIKKACDFWTGKKPSICQTLEAATQPCMKQD